MATFKALATFKRNATFKTVALAGIGAVALGIGSGKADQVFNDDVIITGSLCVGFDCTANMDFGFDTVVLKENNLRIFFDDTSTSAGFPANDWRLIANDSASGGSNFFAIEDSTAARQVFKVTAGAPANSIFVASTGRVGLRTATPVLDLHINTNNTPAMRLEQNNSGGFSAQTWDIAGNEANFFVRDVTGGSRLPFRIRPGAPTSSIDIAASGNVGIGLTSAATKLEVNGGRLRVLSDGADPGPPAAGKGIQMTYLGASDYGLVTAFDNTAAAFKPLRLDGSILALQTLSSGNVGIGTTAPATQLHTTGSVRFAGITGCSAGLQTNASGNVSCLVSSRQFKTIAGSLPASTALANVMALRPQVGTYHATPDVPEHWLIAEDVAAIDPALAGFKDGKPYTVKTQNVVADLVAVIQQQQTRIEALEKQLAR